MTAPATAQPLKLEVGQVYRTRDGRRMKIVRYDAGDTSLPFEESGGRWYTVSGLLGGFEDIPDYAGHLIAEWDALASPKQPSKPGTVTTGNLQAVTLAGVLEQPGSGHAGEASSATIAPQAAETDSQPAPAPAQPDKAEVVERIAADYSIRFGMKHNSGMYLVCESDLRKGVAAAINEALSTHPQPQAAPPGEDEAVEKVREVLEFYRDADYQGTGFWDGISLPGVLFDGGVKASHALTLLPSLAAVTGIPSAQEPVKVDEPTEEMCRRARGFIMGLDLGCRKWGAMQKHLDRGGYPTLPRIRENAREYPTDHITKWDVAECVYLLMTTERQQAGDAA